VIFQGQQVGQLLLVQLADALGNVVIQYKGEELLLFVGVAFKDAPFAALDALCPGDGAQAYDISGFRYCPLAFLQVLLFRYCLSLTF